jgi:hypothetical protein
MEISNVQLVLNRLKSKRRPENWDAFCEPNLPFDRDVKELSLEENLQSQLQGPSLAWEYTTEVTEETLLRQQRIALRP